MDNIYSAKQQRLCVEPLYSSWTPQPNEEHPESPRKFLADANVGVFFSVHQPPLVPDMFLSLDVEVHEDWYAKEHRSYFVWEFDKVPDVVVEVVSNRVGKELDEKLRRYAKMAVPYYVVFDPLCQLSDDPLRVYELYFGKRYRLRNDFVLPDVGLSLILWQGKFEGKEATWLRWCDAEGNLIPTGKERADQETARANQEASRAEQAAKRAELLANKLRELGVDPNVLL